ncbi:uncharacterized protein LOC116301174 [Actinia tenebrosa]|uniref:Uncharacterized protein LOC116301174 n=1 Tax=Actinia tenebrosa TaxID=6105 RepID=A0A6P8IH25_ACTTE|nr:uncharacterized protein LOC116301174 [Actinia tenebrosa]
MASGFARKLCGRRQDEEPDEVVPLRFEEEMRAQQKARLQPETRVQREQKDDLFDAIRRCDLEHIKKLKERFSFKDIRDNVSNVSNTSCCILLGFQNSSGISNAEA